MVHNACSENVVSGFDIAVTVVDTDDDFVFKLFHLVLPPARLSGLSELICFVFSSLSVCLAFQPDTLIGVTPFVQNS